MTANAEKYTMSKKLQFYAVFSVQINNHARRPYQKLKCPSCSKKKKTNDQLVKKYGSAAAEQKEQGKTRPSNA